MTKQEREAFYQLRDRALAVVAAIQGGRLAKDDGWMGIAADLKDTVAFADTVLLRTGA